MIIGKPETGSWKKLLYTDVMLSENPTAVSADALDWIVTLHQTLMDNDKPLVPVHDRALGVGQS